MNRKLLLGLLIALLPVLAIAQDRVRIGPEAGDREIILSGTGNSTNDLDGFQFGLLGSLGWFYTDHLELGLRQSANYADVPNTGDNAWNGSTRGFVDYHFIATDRAWPFIGGSLGYTYGDRVSDSPFAGLEAGLKYFVRPKTFIVGAAEYQYFFDNLSNIDNAFDDGAFIYTLGIGYLF
ncbi:MAG: hypothetical protein L0H63_11595 [Nitrococcus sp.]|nr:hypothetical protein [Nitrococcus sp.]